MRMMEMNFHLSQRPLNSNCVDLLKVFGMVQAVQGALKVILVWCRQYMVP